MHADRIYSLPLEHVGDFSFDEQVVAVFQDMIARSVPGYASILAMTAELAERYAAPDSNIYDLGCSLGAATLLMRERVPKRCTIHAIDSSPAMTSRLIELLSAQSNAGCRVQVTTADVGAIAIRSASFVVVNFMLQFIAPQQREAVLQAIWDGLLTGHALVLSEKVCFEDASQQQLMSDLHHEFKRAHGYSELEISQKRTALERTLIPETIDCHIDRLRRIGFSTVATWFQCFNFVSILAIK